MKYIIFGLGNKNRLYGTLGLDSPIQVLPASENCGSVGGLLLLLILCGFVGRLLLAEYDGRRSGSRVEPGVAVVPYILRGRFMRRGLYHGGYIIIIAIRNTYINKNHKGIEHQPALYMYSGLLTDEWASLEVQSPCLVALPV